MLSNHADPVASDLPPPSYPYCDSTETFKSNQLWSAVENARADANSLIMIDCSSGIHRTDDLSQGHPIPDRSPLQYQIKFLVVSLEVKKAFDMKPNAPSIHECCSIRWIHKIYLFSKLPNKRCIIQSMNSIYPCFCMMCQRGQFCDNSWHGR